MDFVALCVYGKEPLIYLKAYTLTHQEVKTVMPNAQVLEAKAAQVSETVELLKETQTGILVDYRGLNVAEDTELRNKLREANVKYFVIKNRILKRAVDEIGLEGLDEVLHGPTALAVSTEDAVAPAKVLSEFAKSNEKLEIKGGFMDGSAMGLDEIKKLAATPNFETLIAKMMGSLQSPISGLARLLATIADGGEEIADLIAKKAPAQEEAPSEEAPVAEETAPAAEEAPAEETAAEEAPAE